MSQNEIVQGVPSGYKQINNHPCSITSQDDLETFLEDMNVVDWYRNGSVRVGAGAFFITSRNGEASDILSTNAEKLKQFKRKSEEIYKYVEEELDLGSYSATVIHLSGNPFTVERRATALQEFFNDSDYGTTQQVLMHGGILPGSCGPFMANRVVTNFGPGTLAMNVVPESKFNTFRNLILKNFAGYATYPDQDKFSKCQIFFDNVVYLSRNTLRTSKLNAESFTPGETVVFEACSYMQAISHGMTVVETRFVTLKDYKRLANKCKRIGDCDCHPRASDIATTLCSVVNTKGALVISASDKIQAAYSPKPDDSTNCNISWPSTSSSFGSNASSLSPTSSQLSYNRSSTSPPQSKKRRSLRNTSVATSTFSESDLRYQVTCDAIPATNDEEAKFLKRKHFEPVGRKTELQTPVDGRKKRKDPRPDAEPTLVCRLKHPGKTDRCVVRFTTTGHLMRHYQEQERQKRPFICGDCVSDYADEHGGQVEIDDNGKTPDGNVIAFKRKDDLVCQVKSSKHLNVKYACPFCPKEFSKKANIARHLKPKKKAKHHAKRCGNFQDQTMTL